MSDSRPPARDDPDTSLVRCARSGDHGAFSELVRRHQRPLMAKALGSARNLADADELVHAAFMRAWRDLRRLREDARFGPWLHRVLENLTVDRARRRWREVPLPVPDTREAEAATPNPETALLARELVARVTDALGSIPEGRQKEVFRLRYAEGMALGDIADRLGVHSGTVKVQLFRTAKRLRRLLADPEAAR